MECNEETISTSFHFESKESMEVVNEDGNNRVVRVYSLMKV